MAKRKSVKPTEEPAGSRRVKKPRRGPGWLLFLITLLYIGLLAIITVLNMLGPERWWFSSANLYAPQWVWLLPLLFLMPWYLMRAWRWAWLPLLLFVWVAGPLMGLCWPLPWWPAHEATAGTSLRMMTYNVKWGKTNPYVILDEIETRKPDVIVMQDSGGVLQGPLAYLKDKWYTQANDQYVVASHYPLSELTPLWITPKRHRVERFVVHAPGRDIVVFDVHLRSPRDGLSAIRHHRLDGSEDMQENADERLDQATRLAQYVEAEKGPVLLGGDFNAPMPSLVCKRMTHVGLQDAFSLAGHGYGYTYGQSTPIRIPYVRIDHIFVSAPWQVRTCEVGASNGSQHSPVIADLFLPKSPYLGDLVRVDFH